MLFGLVQPLHHPIELYNDIALQLFQMAQLYVVI